MFLGLAECRRGACHAREIAGRAAASAAACLIRQSARLFARMAFAALTGRAAAARPKSEPRKSNERLSGEK